MRFAVTRFALVALASVVVIGAVGLWLFQRLGTSEAIRDAEELTEVTGRGIVEPTVTDGLLRGDRAAIERVDGVVRSRVLDDALVRVKIWTGDGRIVYSDEPRQIGSRYPLDADDLESLETGRVISGVLSDFSEEENRLERGSGKLLEVYMPIYTPTGEQLLFEAYFRYSSLAQVARRTWRDFAPAMLGALLLLGLIQFPLAWQLARRVRESQRERENLLRRAIEASDVERRKIAHDLHDGVVQNLAGISYSLAGAARKAPAPLDETLHDAAAETRRGIRELRTLLVEIYPPELHRTGLAVALAGLLEPCASRGIETQLDVDSEADLGPDVQSLFFRVAQEALRNIVKHAEPRRVKVAVARRDGLATLEIEDDGKGFDPAAPPDGAHFGLRLLADLVRDAGGSLDIDSSLGMGTRVRAEVGAANAARG